MADEDFDTEGALDIVVREQQLRKVRKQIEDELEQVELGVQAGGTGGRPPEMRSDGGGRGLSPSRKRRFARREHRWARQNNANIEDILKLLQSTDFEGGGGGGGLFGDDILGTVLGGGSDVVGAGALTGAAAALTGSAKALMGAAAAMGGSSVVDTVGDLLTGDDDINIDEDFTKRLEEIEDNALEVRLETEGIDIEDGIPVDAPESISVDDPSPLGVEETDSIDVDDPSPLEVNNPSPLGVSDPSPLAVTDPSPLTVVEVDPLAVDDPSPLEVEPVDSIPVDAPESIPVEQLPSNGDVDTGGNIIITQTATSTGNQSPPQDGVFPIGFGGGSESSGDGAGDLLLPWPFSQGVQTGSPDSMFQPDNPIDAFISRKISDVFGFDTADDGSNPSPDPFISPGDGNPGMPGSGGAVGGISQTIDVDQSASAEIGSITVQVDAAFDELERKIERDLLSEIRSVERELERKIEDLRDEIRRER